MRIIIVTELDVMPQIKELKHVCDPAEKIGDSYQFSVYGDMSFIELREFVEVLTTIHETTPLVSYSYDSNIMIVDFI